MDFNYINQTIPLFVQAAFLTLKLGLAGIFLSIIVGIFLRNRALLEKFLF